MDSVRAALGLVNLHALMDVTRGDPSIVIGIIDGPVDLSHPALSSASVSTVKPSHVAMCQNAASGACFHGTAVAGVLCAARGVPAPAISPACTALVYPIFPEESSGARDVPGTTPRELSRAIIETVDAGAKIINLSLGLLTSDITAYRELDEASEYACKRGVILVAAAGNQGRIGFLPLLNHPWMIPVAACDVNGRVTPESNLSPSIGTRGLRAPGVDIPTTSPASHYAPVTGTSVAAAFVTGGLALLWSQFPGATATEVRHLALQAARSPRRSITPPLFDAEGARVLLRIPTTRREVVMEDQKRQDEPGKAQEGQPVTVLQPEPRRAVADTGPRHAALTPHLTSGRGRVVLHVGAGASCPTCAAAAHETAGPPTYVYAIGEISTRFPSPSVEKEYAQSVAGGATANLTDRQVLYNTLKANRHLVNEVCWLFSIEGVESYILVPGDPLMLDQFVEAARPAERGLDTDVIIGTRGPMAPPEMCNALIVPIVVVDRVYSFNKPDLLKALQKPRELKMTADEFRSAADAMFDRIQQIGDNAGATDEHRALNYLAVRYDRIYSHVTEMYANDYSLSRIEVVPSRLSVSTRKLVNVVLSYTNRQTDVTEKFYVRVDVTEKYPFLDKKLSAYFERE